MTDMAENTRVVELEPQDFGVVFNSLNDKRNELIAQGRTTDAVDETILKIAEAPSKKKRWRDEAR